MHGIFTQYVGDFLGQMLVFHTWSIWHGVWHGLCNQLHIFSGLWHGARNIYSYPINCRGLTCVQMV
jgi:hypothetical protein